MKGAARDWRRLERITLDLAAVRDRERALLDQRRTVFVRLLEAGARQVDIAPVAGITPMAVSYALREPEAAK